MNRKDKLRTREARRCELEALILVAEERRKKALARQPKAPKGKGNDS